MTDPSCSEVQDALVKSSDDELPPAEAARIAGHVAHCAACRAELQLLRRSLELAQQVWCEPLGKPRLERTTKNKPSLAPAGRRHRAAMTLNGSVTLTQLRHRQTCTQ